MQKGGGGGERVFSQHKSTGRSLSRARAGEVEGVRGAGCAWASRRLRAKSVRLPGPRRLARPAESAGSGVLGGNPPEREGGDRSPEAAVENWRSLLLILLASGPRPSSYHPPRPAEMRGPLEPKESRCGSQGLQAFLGLVLRAELEERAGASHRGAGGWGRGSEGGGGPGRARALGTGAGRSQVLAALQLVGFLSVGGGRHADVHNVVSGGLVVCCAVRNLLLGHDAIDLCEDVLERFLHVGGIQG